MGQKRSEMAEVMGELLSCGYYDPIAQYEDY